MAERGVIFDVDGVLVDSYRAHFLAWQRLGDRLGLPVTEADFAVTFGRRNAEIIHGLFPDAVPEAEVDALGDWKEERYREILVEAFPAMDGAVELIDALRAAGFGLAVGSSGPPPNVRAALEGLGRAGAFASVVTGADVTVGKPAPEVFEKAAAGLGLPPARCAVVEDATPGLEAACRAGAAAIGLLGTTTAEALEGAGARLVVGSLRELTPAGIAGLIG